MAGNDTHNDAVSHPMACGHPKEAMKDWGCLACSLLSASQNIPYSRPNQISSLVRPTSTAAVPAADLAGEQLIDPPCIFRRKSLGMIQCSCKNKMVEAFSCVVKSVCTVSSTLRPRDPAVEICRLCSMRRLTPEPPQRALTWQVGLTTILKRKYDLLPATLASLMTAGWEKPRLFVDGGTQEDWKGWDIPITVHPKTHPYGNWWLGMQELYVHNPTADRYLMVQDDVKFVRGLRSYLDVVPWPGAGYLNLYTFPDNQEHAKGRRGFFRANMRKRGLGALALVFDKASIVAVLSSAHLIEKFRPIDVNTGKDKDQPWRAKQAIDGGVVEAMNKAGMSEWCHNPSLVQHTGQKSSLGHRNPDAPEFDENFNLKSLIS